MELFLTFLNHFIPFLITIAIIVSIIAIVVGGPYLKYVSFVSKADTEKGREELAKYLAHKTGGRKIDVEHTWPSFLPAARDLHKAHMEKRRQLFG